MATTNLTVPIVIGWKDIEARMAQRNIVEVVRCKDCIHYWKNWKDEGPDEPAVCLASPKDDAFCSEGERKEE